MSVLHTRVIEHDPVERRTELYHYDYAEDKIVLETVWDMDPVLEANRAMYAATDERAGWKGDMHRIGSIPMAVYMDWFQKTSGFRDKAALRRLVNDKDNRAFLVRPVKL